MTRQTGRFIEWERAMMKMQYTELCEKMLKSDYTLLTVESILQ